MDILETQEERVANGECPHLLLVINDFASQGKCLKALDELAIRGRHVYITVFVTTQYSILLSPSIRMNCNGAILFKLSDAELKHLADEGLRTLVEANACIDWVKRHTFTPRSFVYINLRSPDREFNIGFSDGVYD